MGGRKGAPEPGVTGSVLARARWWDGVRDWHQAHKTAMIAYSECQDAENADDCTKRLRLAALRAAAALSKVALEERDARENAMFDLS